MPKYYIKCGTLELIYSTDKDPVEAACTALGESNKFDILDEYFYIDERGMYDYSTAKPDTNVIPLARVCKLAGWELNAGDD